MNIITPEDYNRPATAEELMEASRRWLAYATDRLSWAAYLESRGEYSGAVRNQAEAAQRASEQCRARAEAINSQKDQ